MAVMRAVDKGFQDALQEGGCSYRPCLPCWCVSGNSSAFNTFLDGEMKTLFTIPSKTAELPLFPAKSQMAKGIETEVGAEKQTVRTRPSPRHSEQKYLSAARIRMEVQRVLQTL